MTMPLVELQDLIVRFRAGGVLSGGHRIVHAVERVSFSVGSDEIVGLIGESGSGKTTVGRTIVGLTAPTAGRILFKGKDISRLDRAERRAWRRRVQFVFQDPFGSLDPRMRVGALLAEPLLVHRIGDRATRRARIGSLLARVGLPPDAARSLPHEFSGGQRQRIGIARALAIEPDLIIADEPVAALDMSVQAQILNLLATLRDEMGVSLLMIAHDLNMVAHLCDRVIVMFLGHVVEEGATTEVWRTPRHPYTRALLDATPRVDRAPRSNATAIRPPPLPTVVPPSPLDPPSGCVFRTCCRHALALCADAEPPAVRVHAQLFRCHRPELFA